MTIIVFSARQYDRDYFTRANEGYQFDIVFDTSRLSATTVQQVPPGAVVCVFVNDVLDREVLTRLADVDVRLIALRCAGSDNVDKAVARELGITIINVPAYSPHAVAEHALCLMLAMNRKVCQASSRIRQGDFSLDGLIGFDFHGRSIGIIGTGRIGSVLARTVKAMGMSVMAYDVDPSDALVREGVQYVDIDVLLSHSDVISLHCPLTAQTHYLIDAAAIDKMKAGVMLVNTSRGAVLDTCAVVQGLQTGKIAYLGMDVYELEQGLFFEDHSCDGLEDKLFNTLHAFPNVLLTAHQGFLTADALQNIAATTLKGIKLFEQGETCVDMVVK